MPVYFAEGYPAARWTITKLLNRLGNALMLTGSDWGAWCAQRLWSVGWRLTRGR